MEIRYIAIKNALAARRFHAGTSQDSSKVSVKVSYRCKSIANTFWKSIGIGIGNTV